MTYVRCDRCGRLTSERQSITISGAVDEQLYKLCIDCRLVVERALRDAMERAVSVTPPEEHGAAAASGQERAP